MASCEVDGVELSGIKHCDYCQDDGQSEIASAFCQNCVKYLCASCEKNHNKFLSGHECVYGAEMPVDARNERQDLPKKLTESLADNDFEYSFQRASDEWVEESFSKSKPLNPLKEIRHRINSIDDYGILCACLMPNGEAVLFDYRSGAYTMKVLDDNMKIKTEIPLKEQSSAMSALARANNIALLDDENVIAAFPMKRILQPITIIPNVRFGREIVLRINIGAVSCFNKNIYVSTDKIVERTFVAFAGVQVLSQNGNILQNIQLFEQPSCLCFDNKGNMVYTVGNTLKCINSSNSVVFSFTISSSPQYMCCDDQGNVLFCVNSDVQVINPDNRQKKTIIREKPEGTSVQQSWLWSYNKSNKVLLCCMAIAKVAHLRSCHTGHKEHQVYLKCKKYKY